MKIQLISADPELCPEGTSGKTVPIQKRSAQHIPGILTPATVDLTGSNL